MNRTSSFRSKIDCLRFPCFDVLYCFIVMVPKQTIIRFHKLGGIPPCADIPTVRPPQPCPDETWQDKTSTGRGCRSVGPAIQSRWRSKRRHAWPRAHRRSELSSIFSSSGPDGVQSDPGQSERKIDSKKMHWSSCQFEVGEWKNRQSGYITSDTTCWIKLLQEPIISCTPPALPCGSIYSCWTVLPLPLAGEQHKRYIAESGRYTWPQSTTQLVLIGAQACRGLGGWVGLFQCLSMLPAIWITEMFLVNPLQKSGFAHRQVDDAATAKRQRRWPASNPHRGASGRHGFVDASCRWSIVAMYRYIYIYMCVFVCLYIYIYLYVCIYIYIMLHIHIILYCV